MKLRARATGNSSFTDIVTKYSILVSPRSRINEDAIPYGEQVYYLHTSEVLKLFERSKQMLIELRSTMTNEISGTYRERVLQCMTRFNLTPEKVCELVTSKPVTELPTYN